METVCPNLMEYHTEAKSKRREDGADNKLKTRMSGALHSYFCSHTVMAARYCSRVASDMTGDQTDLWGRTEVAPE